MGNSLGTAGGSRIVIQRGAALHYFDQEDCMDRTGARVAGLSRWVVLTAMVACIAGSSPALFALTNTLTINVVSATDNSTHITPYKYIINIDNTGTTEQRSPAPGTGCSPQDAGYPDSCNWVSIAGVKSSAPIYTQGNQDDFPGGVFTINGSGSSLACRSLPDLDPGG